MGLLRYYLAAAVIAWHTAGFYGFYPMAGYTAVQVFYMISGFYMALILNTKYVGAGSYRVFLANRFLRIYPAYWAMLGLTFAMCFVGNWYLGHSRLSPYQHHPLTPFSWIFLVASNLSLLGQDVVTFLDLRPDGALAWPTDWVHRPSPALHEFMLLPQGWSLSIELMFYAIAPFLVRRPIKQVVALILAGLALRAWIYVALGLNLDPWGYRFFPTELSLFLGGTLSYRLYEWLRRRSPDRRQLAAIGIAFAALTLSYTFLTRSLLPEYSQFIMWTYFGILVAVIPVLFLLTKDNPIDRYVGELSYPIYIAHMLVLMIVPNVLPRRTSGVNPYIGLVTLGLSTIFAAVMVHGLINPIDQYRHRLSRRNRGVPAPTPAESTSSSSTSASRSGSRVIRP